MDMHFSSGTRVLVMALLIGFLVLPGVAAAESRSGGSIVVEAGETVDGDLEAFGGSVIVRGTVTGDLNAFAGNVVIEGTVEGDVETAAGNIVIARNATIGGNLEAAGGNVRIAGTIDGDAEIGAEQITLAPTARLGGDLEYGGNLDRADGAVVSGSVTEGDVQVSPVGGFAGQVPPWTFDVYGFLVNLALGALLIVAFPVFSRRVTDSVLDEPLRSGGIGFLALIAVPVALVLIALTIIGIPLTILGALLFALAAWIGAIYGRIAIGTWLSSLVDVENQWLALFLGVTVVALLTQVPWLGGLVELAVFLLGFGALVTTLTRRYRRRRGTDASHQGDVDGQPT